MVRVEHPAHAVILPAEVLEDLPRATADPRIARVDAVLDEQQVLPVRGDVLRRVHRRAGPAAVGGLLLEDRRDWRRAHRAGLRFAELRVARATVEERPQRVRAYGGIAAFEEPGHRVAAEEHSPVHGQAPPMDSSEITNVGLPRPDAPKVRSFATPVIDDKSFVRLPAIVMPCTGYRRSPFSR